MYKKWFMGVIIALVTLTVANAEASSFPYKTLESVQVKASASSNAKTIQTLKANTNISVVATKNGWANVQVGKTKGYLPLKSILPLEIPIKEYSYNEVMTYKGTDIASVSGKSVKIDPVLLPFFKQNATTLRSTLAKPIIKNNTIVGFNTLTIGFFTPIDKTFSIDQHAASRIDSLSLQVRKEVTVSTAAPLRQVILNASPDFFPVKENRLEVTLNGPIQQFHSDGLFTLKGKGKISRWDIGKGTTYSFSIPALYSGEIGFLNMKNEDGMVRGSNALNVHAVSGPTKASIIDGTHGVLGTTKVTTIIQGKRMGKDGVAINRLWSNLTATQLESLLKQLNIPYSPERMNAYVKAFTQNHKADANKRLVASKEDVRFIVRTVDTVMSLKQSSPPYVSIDHGRVNVKTDHLVRKRSESFVPYKRSVTAHIKDGDLQSITFKREEDLTIDLQAYQHDNGRYITSVSPGSYRVVTIDSGVTKGFTYDITKNPDIEKQLGKGYFELIHVNGNALATYNQPAPDFEAKIVKHGYASYLVVRSSDRNWIKNVHSYTLPVNKNYIAGGHVISDKIDLGNWSPNDSVVLSHYDGKMNDGLIVKAYGYQNAKLK